MLDTPSSPWPCFTDEEADAARAVLLSNRVNYWTGEEGRAFEREFAEQVGTRYAVAVANGTVALDLTWVALGIAPGDEVIVTPRTFIASVSSIVNAGAVPVFVDVDRTSGNITAESAAPALTDRTRAILCVHLAGWPCEMDALADLARSHRLRLVEDCAQAHGALYRGRSVGALGDIGAWSFCQDKIITTGGEGGMTTTDDQECWSRMWSYKDHGKSWEATFRHSHAPGFRWLHEGFGTNWRLTEMQSAIGRIQLKRLPHWHAARSRNAEAILAVARALPGLRTPEVPTHIRHAWYRCYVFVESGALKSGWSRDRIMVEILGRNVPCSSGTCSEIYREKAFEGTGFAPARRLPVAQELGETSLAFLVHPSLTETEIGRTGDVLRQVLAEAVR